MSKWKVFKFTGSASWNMALDEALLENVHAIGGPVLRFYGWKMPAATFGYFQHYDEVAAWTELRPLIRRPTGGGLVLHVADWTYSVTIPPSDPWYQLRAVESYRKLHEWVTAALQASGVTARLAPERQNDGPGQCFIGAEQFDVLVDGKKVAGAAQRRTKDGLLIQGSVQRLDSDMEKWKRAMVDTLSEWEHWELTGEIQKRADELAASKYSQPAYNRRR